MNTTCSILMSVLLLSTALNALLARPGRVQRAASLALSVGALYVAASAALDLYLAGITYPLVDIATAAAAVMVVVYAADFVRTDLTRALASE